MWMESIGALYSVDIYFALSTRLRSAPASTIQKIPDTENCLLLRRRDEGLAKLSETNLIAR